MSEITFRLSRADIPPRQRERAEKLPERITARVWKGTPPKVRSIVDWDQVRLDADLGLWQAEQKWDSGAGVAFSTFAMSYVLGAAREAVRRTQPLTRAQQRMASEAYHDGKPTPPVCLNPFELDQAVCPEDIGVNKSTTYMELLLDRETDVEHTAVNRDIVRAIFSELHHRDVQVLRMLVFEQRLNTEMARFFGVSKSRVQQIFQHARENARTVAERLGIEV